MRSLQVVYPAKPIVESVEGIESEAFNIFFVHTVEGNVSIHGSYYGEGAWRPYDIVALREHEQVLWRVVLHEMNVYVVVVTIEYCVYFFAHF